MKRGDVVLAVSPGDYGKPRPVVVIQSDRLPLLESMIICPLTSDLANAEPVRMLVEPSAENGLRLPSQIMVEKVTAVPRLKCREIIGRLDESTMRELNERLAMVIGLAD